MKTPEISELRLPATLIQTPGGSPDLRERALSSPSPLLRVLGWIGIAVATVAVVALLLLTVGPLVLPYKTLTVYSGSMEPTIHVGSVIVDTPVAAREVRIGDVITFQKPSDASQLVTHRVVAIETGPGGQSFVTKGDANSTSDGWRVPAAGNGYRYWFSIPSIGFLLVWLQSPFGRILFLVIPAGALGLLTLYELWWPRRAPEEG